LNLKSCAVNVAGGSVIAAMVTPANGLTIRLGELPTDTLADRFDAVALKADRGADPEAA
jgi:hypothetical protein